MALNGGVSSDLQLEGGGVATGGTHPEASARTVLGEAADVVFGERARNYGHPRDNFRRIAALWNGWFAARGIEVRLTPEDTADLMILLKLARLMATPDHRDSMVDIAGYAEARARAVGVDA